MAKLVQYIFLFLMLLIVAHDFSFAQKNAKTPHSDDSIYIEVDQPPEFMGGTEAMEKFIYSNIDYPSAEREAEICGKVHVQFVVKKDGSISDIKIARGVKGGLGLDKEAIRVVSIMPSWKPAKKRGRNVNVLIYTTFEFGLSHCREFPLLNVKVVDYDATEKLNIDEEISFMASPKGGEVYLNYYINQFMQADLHYIFYDKWPNISYHIQTGERKTASIGKYNSEGRLEKCTFFLNLEVSKDGKVSNIRIKENNSKYINTLIIDSLLKAIEAMRWNPAQKNGIAIPSSVLLNVNFTT